MEPSREQEPAPAAMPAPFQGRTLSLEMGSVRLGGSGRPVAIPASRALDGDSAERRQPRVTLEPQPRSPYRRKLETSVDVSLSSAETPSRHRVMQRGTVAPPVRVHTTHHPTQRTPVAVALRRVDARKQPDRSRPESAAPRKRPAASEPAVPAERGLPVSHASKVKKPEVDDQETARSASIQESTQSPTHASQGLKPEQLVLLTREPPARESTLPTRSFHIHERLPRDIQFDDIVEMGDLDNANVFSGWREVDDKIDHIYEDPSIDIVQLQLLIHSKQRSGEKRKAVERDRLQAAAAEMQKERLGHTQKILEFQHRRKQILKMSDDIRSRNRSLARRNDGKKKPSSQAKIKADEAPALPQRKPPVPRLSQVGSKTKARKGKTADSATSKALGDGKVETEKLMGLGEIELDSDPTEDQSSSRASESILLRNDGTKSSAPSAGGADSTKKTNKRRKPSSITAAQDSKSGGEKNVPMEHEEKLQRRAVAREYMHMQKQTRQILRAKMEQQRQLEEDRRRLELQRLENTRLLELEAARKRRVRQKQRDRAVQRKYEQGRQQEQEQNEHFTAAAPSPMATTANGKDRRSDIGHEADTENQSFRCNGPRNYSSIAEPFDWPGGDGIGSSQVSSAISSPRNEQGHVAKSPKRQIGANSDPKVEKLLALEEQTKRLALKLQSLSKHAAGPTDPPREETLSGSSLPYDNVDSDHDLRDSSESHSRRSDSSVQSKHSPDLDGEHDGHSATRIDQEEYAFFDGGFPHPHDLDVQLDFSSIGVQKIQVVWPSHEDITEDGGVKEHSTRFEILSSSSSSSSSSEQRKEDESNGRLCTDYMPSSPKLLENSVDSYAQRLLDLSVRRPTPARTEASINTDTASKGDGSNQYSMTNDRSPGHPSQFYRAKRKQPAKTSDAELLRLIRESDDNLSVIDREAKRRFRLQQDRVRQRREDQERQEQVKLTMRLGASVTAHEETAISMPEADHSVTGTHQTEHDSGGSRVDRAHLAEFEKLDEILEAVKTGSCESSRREEAKEEVELEIEQDRDLSSQPPAAIEFWNSQLHHGVRLVPHVEIDRSNIQTQQEYNLEEDEEDGSSRLRLLSPQTLAKRLLAAVDYHDAINEAHIQLSMMEKSRAVEAVQHDTIALAQAFKDEMDSNMLAQQLADEHEFLENKFDTDLKQVTDQLEMLREAEQREHEQERKRMVIEAREARRRESAVQTDLPHRLDAATSARLRIEAASGTDRERVDTGVQHTRDDSFPAYNSRLDINPQTAFIGTGRLSMADDEVSDGYAQETFDQTSLCARAASSPIQKQAMELEAASEGEGDSVVDDAEEVLSDGGHSCAESHSSIEEEEDDIKSVDERSNGSIKSASYRDDVRSTADDDDELKSVIRSHQNQSLSASALYDEDDFELEASLVQSEGAIEPQSDSVASDSENIVESEPASRSHSEPESFGYEEDGFENDASASREPKMTEDQALSDGENEGSLISANEVDEVSENDEKQSEGGDDIKSIDDMEVSSQSNESSSHDHEKDITAKHTNDPSPIRAVHIRGSIPVSDVAATPLVNLSNLASVVPVAPEIAHSYLNQLENRKKSEEALLDIRLVALESKLHQELKGIMDDIAKHDFKSGNTRGQYTLAELELQRNALQMAYLAEKANIESQKSACVSRYYQDLLAFQSLGSITTKLLVGAPVDLQQRVQPSIAAPLERPSIVVEAPPKERDISQSDAYDDDEFLTSKAESDSALESPPRKKTMDSVVDEDGWNMVDDEEDDAIHSAESITSDRESDRSHESGDVVEDGQDYSGEEFASVSEAAVEVDNADRSTESTKSEPLVADENEDDIKEMDLTLASVNDEDEVAAVHESTAIQDVHDGSQGGKDEYPLDSNILADSVVVETEIKSALEETSQVYDEDFASISEPAAIIVTPPTEEEMVDEVDEEAMDRTEHGEDEVSDENEAGDAYDEDFASASENESIPKEFSAAFVDEIEEVTPITGVDVAESDSDAVRNDPFDDDYEEDGFEASEMSVEMVVEAPAVADELVIEPSESIHSPTILRQPEEEGESERYSDDDFDRSSAASNTSSLRGDESRREEPSSETDPAVTSPCFLEQAPPLQSQDHEPLELSTQHSLSASEMNLAIATPTAESHTDTKTALVDSISGSIHEEDLTTASMEEQMKRIEDLKRELDDRKQAMAAVQKKLRVEKRKEHLREAETQLWAEMERLESELVADERILELTRQRGRLESMELEAKHSALQLRGKEPSDLLADYDYCEAVETVKPVVIKQDHEVQVRLAQHQRILANRDVHLSTSGVDCDLLLAFDHVEIAELPIASVATSIDMDNCFDLSEAARAAGLVCVEEKKPIVKGSADVSQNCTISGVEHDEDYKISTSKRDYEKPHGDALDGVETVDLLWGYDHVEKAEVDDSMGDLLHGYDHVESAESITSFVDRERVAPTPLALAVMEKLDTSKQKIESDFRSARDNEQDIIKDLRTRDERNGIDGNGNIATTNVVEVADEESEMQDREEPEPKADTDARFIESEGGSDVPNDLANSTHEHEPVQQSRDEHKTHLPTQEEPTTFADDEELVSRTTEDLLKILLRSAVADITSISYRKVTHEIISTTAPSSDRTTIDDRATTSRIESAETCNNTSWSRTLLQSQAQEWNDTNDSTGGDAGELKYNEESHYVNDDGVVYDNEQRDTQYIEAIVDRLYSDLATSTIQDAMKVEMKRRRAAEVEANRTIQQRASLKHSIASDDRSGHQSEQSVAESIVAQLRLVHHGVSLPSIDQKHANQRQAVRTLAVRDAVLDVASTVYDHLSRGRVFCDEGDEERKRQMLVDRVNHQMMEEMWRVRERAKDEMDRFASKISEEEQGEVDQDDLRLLESHQRLGMGTSLSVRFQHTIARNQVPWNASAGDAAITPRQRRRGGSASSTHVNHPGLASRILEQEERQITERITERMMRDLVERETAAAIVRR